MQKQKNAKTFFGDVSITFFYKQPCNRVYLNASSNIIVSSVSLAKNSLKWRRKDKMIEILVSEGLLPFVRMSLSISFETQLAKVEDKTLLHRDLVGIFEEEVDGSDSAGDVHLT